jgi:hypothetical protein
VRIGGKTDKFKQDRAKQQNNLRGKSYLLQELDPINTCLTKGGIGKDTAFKGKQQGWIEWNKRNR